jgi:hypothetical protein
MFFKEKFTHLEEKTWLHPMACAVISWNDRDHNILSSNFITAFQLPGIGVRLERQAVWGSVDSVVQYIFVIYILTKRVS